jgi:hypothetical protein
VKPNKVRFLGGKPDHLTPDKLDHAAAVAASHVIESVPEPDRATALAEVLSMLGLVAADSDQTGFEGKSEIPMTSLKGYTIKNRR